MSSKLIILGFGVLLFVSMIGIEFMENADALKSKGNHLTTYGSSSDVCGDKLCSEIESKKPEHMKKEYDKMMKQDTMMDGTMMDGTMMDGTMMDGTMMDGTMMDGTMMDGTMMDGTMMDEIVKSEIQTILDQTNYSQNYIMNTIAQLDSYLSTLDESTLQQKATREITNIVFYAQHEQIPTEIAIYEIYEFLK